MIVGIGIDIIEVARIARLAGKSPQVPGKDLHSPGDRILFKEKE